VSEPHLTGIWLGTALHPSLRWSNLRRQCRPTLLGHLDPACCLSHSWMFTPSHQVAVRPSPLGHPLTTEPPRALDVYAFAPSGNSSVASWSSLPSTYSAEPLTAKGIGSRNVSVFPSTLGKSTALIGMGFRFATNTGKTANWWSEFSHEYRENRPPLGQAG